MSKCTAFVLFVHFLTTIVKLHFDAVSVFHAGAPGFEEVTQLIDHYFAEGNVGVSFDQRRPVLSETQSQSVDGTEEVTQDWMVPEQLCQYELKQSKKKLRFEIESKEFAEKEKQRRSADGGKGGKFGKVKKRLSTVAEEGGTPRRSPRVAGMKKNLGKRTAEVGGSDDPQRKRLHVTEGPNSDDDDFVLADYVKDVHPCRRKDCGSSKSLPKHARDDIDEDVGGDSGEEVDAAPKVC